MPKLLPNVALAAELAQVSTSLCNALQDRVHLRRGEVEVPNYDAGRRGTGALDGALDGALQDSLLLPRDLHWAAVELGGWTDAGVVDD